MCRLGPGLGFHMAARILQYPKYTTAVLAHAVPGEPASGDVVFEQDIVSFKYRIVRLRSYKYPRVRSFR